MTDVFRYSAGELPLLISVPHDGRDVPDDLRERMTSAGLALPDTDWHVARLYDFAARSGAHMLVANYSRYVVDLNRAADDGELYPGQLSTGLCPEKTFAGESIYRDGTMTEDEKRVRIAGYWRPYHDCIAETLERIRSRFGRALLWDAHSIPSQVPRLFDGDLPLLNLGSNDGRSCTASIEQRVATAMSGSVADSVVNGRFKGGFITRHYGDPKNNVHALQLEIAQRAYMDEASLTFDDRKARTLRATLSGMIDAFVDAGTS